MSGRSYPPKAILFDLDNTLWHRDVAVKRVAAAQHAAFTELAAVRADAYADRLLTLDDRGRAEKALVYEQIVKDFGLPADLASELRHHFWSSYKECCELAPEALPLLSALRAGGIKTGIITNGTMAVQDAKIAGLGLAPLMDVILVSEREGVRKPDREIFDRALSRLGVTASEAWFVGDHPEADIQGAAGAGLTAVWVRSWVDAAPHAAYAIDTLDQLLPLLAGDQA